RSRYLECWEKLRAGGFIYPCKCSRKDVAEASLAPHDENEEPIYPCTCRPRSSAEAAVSAAAGKNLQATRLPPQISLEATAEVVTAAVSAAGQKETAASDGGSYKYRGNARWDALAISCA